MNSEEFRETFLRTTEKGPPRPKMAGKKEAKQRAGPSGRKEKYRRETGEPSGVKDFPEDAGRKSAQETQKKEAHTDLKDQGEVKKSSVAKRRQVRKVVTMGSYKPRQKGKWR